MIDIDQTGRKTIQIVPALQLMNVLSQFKPALNRLTCPEAMQKDA